jgi:hypothetical protein
MTESGAFSKPKVIYFLSYEELPPGGIRSNTRNFEGRDDTIRPVVFVTITIS